MKISVVIPARNEEKYLPQTLASLTRLKRKPDEVIVVDNGSTDNTAQDARLLGARVVSSPDRGVSRARQKGLETARGDIVAYTDADTIVPPDWLTKIEHALTRPGVVGVFGNYILADGLRWHRFHVRYVQDPLAKLLLFFGIPMTAGCNFAFWRDIGRAVGGFPTDFTMLEENEMAKRLMARGKIVYLSNNSVITSGRRGFEGLRFPLRYIIEFPRWVLFRKSAVMEFTDIRMV